MKNTPQTGASDSACATPADGAAQPGAAGAPAKPKESLGKAFGSLAFWIGMIVVLKIFVADIFVIPTGSMEPTLHGRDNAGDRILCTKINYLWRNPQRWEVFVFKFPYMQTPQGEQSPYKGENYIKRCVGLPGETIALRRGDVFVSKDGEPLQRQIKSPAVQAGIWIPVYEQALGEVSAEELGYFWQVANWRKDGNAFVSGGESAVLTYLSRTRFDQLPGIPDRYFRRQYVDYACRADGCGGKLRRTASSPMLTARCPRCQRMLTEEDIVYYDFRCGYPINRYRSFMLQAAKLGDSTFRSTDDDWHFVPDLRIQTRARLAAGAELELQIFDDRHICTAVIRADGRLRFKVDGRPLPAELLRPEQQNAAELLAGVTLVGTEPGSVQLPAGTIQAGAWHEWDFQRVDGTLRLFVDGKPVLLSGLFDVGVPEDQKDPQNSHIDIVARGAVALERLRIDRDIYYYCTLTPRSRFINGLYRLPSNGYLALGDNQPSSSDSRDWGPVPQENLVGTGQLTWWPPQAMRLLSLGQ